LLRCRFLIGYYTKDCDQWFPDASFLRSRYTKDGDNKADHVRAITFDKYGGPEVLQWSQMADPSATSGEIAVDVHAASINGVDAKTRVGTGAYKVSFPHVLGRDFSGVVSSVGSGVSDIAVGDSVFGVLDQGKDGTYAERVATPANLVVKKPHWLSHAEAAAVGLTGITALWAIEDTAQVQPGETVLIHGAAGGVGSFAVQLAVYFGAEVVATASSVNRDFVLSLGAHKVLDYAVDDFRTTSPPCDVVFDTVGGETQVHSYNVLKPSGRLIWIAPAPPAFVPLRKDVVAMRPNVRRDRPHLERVLHLLETGAVRTPPIQTFPLENAVEAHRVAEMRHVPGKLVLTHFDKGTLGI
jgi:NADPH:quinone reductase-like Zn-dependent oxidoreductase